MKQPVFLVERGQPVREQWVNLAGARVCDPQQFPNFKTLQSNPNTFRLAKLLRVTDPRSVKSKLTHYRPRVGLQASR